MARKHIVVCQNCGRQFDASKGGYYNNQTRRYTCKSCIKKHNAGVRERSTGMRQSMGAMIAKIGFGALFVISGFTGGIPAMSESVGGGIGYIFTGLILGAALIAWGLLPYLKAKKEKEAAAAQAAASREATEFARMNTPWTCPACGAKTKGNACEYCGEPRR